MNILNFKQKDKPQKSISDMVLKVKDFSTQIKQLKFKQNLILEKLEQKRDGEGRLFDENKNLLGSKKKESRYQFDQKGLEAVYPNIYNEFYKKGEINGQWRWL